jgi:hypothetical protein
MALNEKKTPEHHHTESEMVRRFKSNPFIFIGTFVVLVIVIIAFVLVPAIVPEFRGANFDLTFGYYDKVPINYVPGNYFSQSYDMISRSRQNREGENYTNASRQIWRQSFEDAAVHTAILQEMKLAGYKAPAKVVDREVAMLPQFQENGRFSATLYRQMDENRRLALWKQEQDKVAKVHFFSDSMGLLKPGAEADFIGRMAAVERSFEMAVFPVSNYPDEEYDAYAQTHADLFRSVHLSMITVNSSRREAERILALIKNGETTFEDAARAYSQDNYADRGGDMGIRLAHELIFDISDSTERETVIALARGGYSDVLSKSSSWCFFRAEEAVQAADFSDPATMERVRSYVRNYERGRMEDWAVEWAMSFISMTDEIDFAEAAFLQEVTIRRFGPIPLNYGNVVLFSTLESQSVEELAYYDTNDNFWRVAFSTPVNTPSQPIVLGANVLVLFPVAETEVEESSIGSIASTFSAYWLDRMSELAVWQSFFSSPKMEDRFDEIYYRYLYSME